MSEPHVDLLKRLNDQKSPNNPLFRYRVTEFEYNVLVEWLSRNFHQSSNIRQFNRQFKGLFVLYASEWFRRKYSGGQLGYSDLFFELDVDYNSIGYLTVRDLLIDGFEFWELEVVDRPGRQFISTLVANSGIPIQLISSDKRGRLVNLLSGIIQNQLGSRNPLLIRDELRDKSYAIPSAYRQEFVYDLFESLCNNLVNLIERTDPALGNNLLLALNKLDSNWREQLPVHIDSSNTEAFLNSLVLKSKPKGQTKQFYIVGEIQISDLDTEPRLDLTIRFPDKVSSLELKNRFGISGDDAVYQLTFEHGNESYIMALYLISGTDCYSPSRQTIHFAGLDSIVRVRVKYISGVVRLDVFDYGIDLSSPDPWIFSVNEVDPPMYKSSGSRTVAGRNALVAVEDKFIPGPTTAAERLGTRLLGRSLYLIKDEIIFEASDDSNLQYQVRFGNTDSVDAYWVYDILKSVATKEYSLVRTEPGLISPSITLSKSKPNVAYGPNVFTAKRNYISVSRRKLCVLDRRAKWYWSMAQGNRLILELVDWHLTELILMDLRYSNSIIKIQENRASITIVDDEALRPVDELKIRLKFVNNITPLDIAFPIPIPNGQWLNAHAEIHPLSQPVKVKDLVGMRFYIQKVSQDDQIHLISNEFQKSMSVDDEVAIGDRLEIRPIDFIGDIKNILRYSKQVTLSYAPGGVQRPGITIKDYPNSLKISSRDGKKYVSVIDSSRNTLKSNSFSSITVFPLSQLDDPRTLICKKKAEVVFELDNNFIEADRWLILPHDRLLLDFVPTILDKRDLIEEDRLLESLAEVMTVTQESLRRTLVREKMEMLLNDSWGQKQKEDYLYICQFIKVFDGHRFIRECLIEEFTSKAKLIALAAIDLEYSKYIWQMVEQGLIEPILIGQDDWNWALSHSHHKIEDVSIERFRKEWIVTKIPGLLGKCPYSLYQALVRGGFPVPQTAISQICSSRHVIQYFLKASFHAMRNRTANLNLWPPLEHELKALVQDHIREIRVLIDFYGMDDGWVPFVSLPLALGIVVANNQVPDTFLSHRIIRNIDLIRSIDQEWFENAFNASYSASIQ